MTAPDKNEVAKPVGAEHEVAKPLGAKPLHEQIADYLEDWKSHRTSKAIDLLREAAAELSRMRTALEGTEKDAARYRLVRELAPDAICCVAWRYKAACDFGAPDEAIDAAIAERALAPEGRALTAGSGNE